MEDLKSLESRQAIIARRMYRKNIKGDAFNLSISSNLVVLGHLKKRLEGKGKVLAELCCGIGITLESLGNSFERLIGVDNDKKVLSYCARNLKDANLFQKTTLIQGDINDEKVFGKIKADIVIYDVPFWRPHMCLGKGNLIKRNPPLKRVVAKIRKISKNIVIFAPPDYDYKTIKNQVGKCEFQRIIINGTHDRNYVYLGDLVQKEGITEVNLG